jgi:hypothetical protein
MERLREEIPHDRARRFGLAPARALGLDFGHAAPICLFLTVLPPLAMPPSLREWRLTGRHRLVAGISQSDPSFTKIGLS